MPPSGTVPGWGLSPSPCALPGAAGDADDAAAGNQRVLVEAAERATVEDERLAARALEVDHLADDQVVVARDVDAGHLAAQDGERVHDRQVAGRVDDRVAGREGGAGLGEGERDVALAAVQDVHGVAAAAADDLE